MPGPDKTVSRRHTTAARRAIGSAVARRGSSFTAREIFVQLQDGSPVGLTTVYRTLALLRVEGAVREAGHRGGELLYAACEVSGHHHHLVCQGCGAVTESEVCHCESLESDLSARYGFVLKAGDANYYGLCAGCAGTPGAGG